MLRARDAKSLSVVANSVSAMLRMDVGPVDGMLAGGIRAEKRYAGTQLVGAALAVCAICSILALLCRYQMLGSHVRSFELIGSILLTFLVTMAVTAMARGSRIRSIQFDHRFVTFGVGIPKWIWCRKFKWDALKCVSLDPKYSFSKVDSLNLFARLNQQEMEEMSRREERFPGDQVLCLQFRSNWVGRPLPSTSVCVSVASILPEDRRTLLHALKEYAPQVEVDPSAVQALEANHEVTYTQLWLAELASSSEAKLLQNVEKGAVIGGGKYQIVEPLAAGGEAVVYSALVLDAHHVQLGTSAAGLGDSADTSRHVVVREILLPVYGPGDRRREALAQIELEVAILKEVKHPQVVRLIDHFIEDHRAYLVLERIEGMTLAQFVRAAGPMPEAQCLHVALQMCEILRSLHTMQPPVIHRDFTPDNLILDKGGMVKLIDFGVAQFEGPADVGVVVGKHAYVAPEQFRGRPTTRSDIYSLGATLHFLLTGTTPEPISASRPRQIKPTLSAQLDDVIAYATAPEEMERIAAVEELIEKLKRTEISTAPAAALGS